MIPDKCILQSIARVSAFDLMTRRGDDKLIKSEVDRQLRIQLAEELQKVGTRFEEQTPDGLVVRHEVLVFNRADFYRIVREEAARLFERSHTYIPVRW